MMWEDYKTWIQQNVHVEYTDNKRRLDKSRELNWVYMQNISTTREDSIKILNLIECTCKIYRQVEKTW